MIELTEHQESVLIKLANSAQKFVTFTSIEADGQAKETIDGYFAQAMQLVENGLCYDISTLPKEQRMIAELKEDEPREFRVLKATPMVNMMFGRGRCKRSIN